MARRIDELAAQRGKRGVITIRVGKLVRTIVVPVERMKNPLDAMRRRNRRRK